MNRERFPLSFPTLASALCVFVPLGFFLVHLWGDTNTSLGLISWFAITVAVCLVQGCPSFFLPEGGIFLTLALFYYRELNYSEGLPITRFFSRYLADDGSINLNLEVTFHVFLFLVAVGSLCWSMAKKRWGSFFLFLGNLMIVGGRSDMGWLLLPSLGVALKGLGDLLRRRRFAFNPLLFRANLAGMLFLCLFWGRAQTANAPDRRSDQLNRFLKAVSLTVDHEHLVIDPALPDGRLQREKEWVLLFENNLHSVYLKRNEAPEVFQRVESYYRSEKLPFDPREGLHLGKVWNRNPKWVRSFEEKSQLGRYPDWQRVARFAFSDSNFYLTRGIPVLAVSYLVEALGEDPKNPYLSVKLLEVFAAIRDLENTRVWLSVVEKLDIPAPIYSSVQYVRHHLLELDEQESRKL